MSSSKGEPSQKIKWNKVLTAKIDHENQLEFKRLRAEAKTKGPKVKKSKKEDLPKE